MNNVSSATTMEVYENFEKTHLFTNVKTLINDLISQSFAPVKQKCGHLNFAMSKELLASWSDYLWSQQRFIYTVSRTIYRCPTCAVHNPNLLDDLFNQSDFFLPVTNALYLLLTNTVETYVTLEHHNHYHCKYDHVFALIANMITSFHGSIRPLCLECPDRDEIDIDGSWQMELAETLVGSTLKPLVESLIQPLLGGLTDTIREGANSAFQIFDSPALFDTRNGDFGVADRSRLLTSLAFLEKDIIPDQADVVGIDTDMDILRRLKIPTRYRTASWTTSSAVKSSLAEVFVHPMLSEVLEETIDSVLYQTFQNTPLSYFGGQFLLWRGSIKMEVEVVATNFHQGQLLIVFNPDIVLGLTFDPSRTCIQATIDLSTENRTVMEIPFVTNCDYLYTTQNPAVAATQDNALGRFNVFVQNVLQTNANISDTIDVNLYISAGDDFEFRVPYRSEQQVLYEGVWQMESAEEVLVNENVTAKIRPPPFGIYKITDKNVSCLHGVQAADYENVMDRDYLVLSNVAWASTLPQWTLLGTIPLPTAVSTAADLAPSGLTSFHRFVRASYEITIRVNAIPFHAGMLLIHFDPGASISAANFSRQSLTQTPHVFLNPAMEKSAKLVVPYCYYRRLMLRPDTFGSVNIVVYNVLRSSGTPTVNISAWARLVDPYVGVKCVRQGEFQMEKPSASQTRAPVDSRMYFREGADPCGGYLSENHMNVKSLLSRPETVYEAQVTLPSDLTTTYRGFAAGPEFGGKAHWWWTLPWTFRSGANRIHLFTNVAHIHNVVFLSSVHYRDVLSKWSAITANPSEIRLYNGSRFDKVFDGGYCVQIPHYHTNPIIHNQRSASFSRAETIAGLYVSYVWDAAPGTSQRPPFRAWVFHSVGDDFRLYYPTALPKTRRIKPAALLVSGTEQMEVDPLKLLKSGDVESNPGPVLNDIKIWARDYMFPGLRGSEENVQKLEELRALAESALDNLPRKAFDALTWFADFVAQLYVLAQSDSNVMRGVALAALGMKCYGVYADADALLKQLQEVIAVRVEVQGEIDYSFIAASIATVLVGAMVAILGFTLPRSAGNYIRTNATQGFADLCVQTSKIAGCALVVPRLWIAIKAAVISAINYFIEGEDAFSDWEKKNSERLDQWMSNWDKLSSQGAFLEEKIWCYNDGVSNFEVLSSLVDVALEIRRFAVQKPSFNITLIRTADAILETYRKAYRFNNSSNMRAEPVGIYIYGDSGAGKSTLSSTLLPFCVLGKLGLLSNYEELKKEVYTTPSDPNHKFKDRYHGQKWYQVDDFASSAQDEDSLEMINLISVSAYVVNKADLTDKGQLFTSPFVCVTSNKSGVFNNAAIRNSEALVRRFPIAYKICLAVTGGIDNLDYGNVLSLLNQCTSVDEVINQCNKLWTFKTLDLANGTVTPDSITFSELVMKCVAAYTKKTAGVNGIADALSQIKFQGESDVVDAQSFFMAQIRGLWRRELWEPTVAARLFSDVFTHFSKYGYRTEDDVVEAAKGGAATLTTPTLHNNFDLFVAAAFVEAQKDGAEEKKTEWRGLIWTLAKVSGVIAISAVALMAMVRIFRSFCSEIVSVQGQEYASSAAKIKRARPPRKAFFQGEVRDVHEKVEKNLVRIELRSEITEKGPGMNALAVTSKLLAIPRHFYDRWLDHNESFPVIVRKNVVIPFSLAKQCVMIVDNSYFGERDCVFVYLLGSNVDHARDIRSFFMPILDFQKLTDVQLGVILGSTRSKFISSVARSFSFEGKKLVRAQVSVPTIEGDCGRPYVLLNPLYRSFILGLHSMLLDSGETCYTPVFKEDVLMAETYFQNFDAVLGVEEENVEPLHVTEYKSAWWQQDTMECLGKAVVNTTPILHFDPPKTDFVRSPLMHVCWHDEFLPAVRHVVQVPAGKIHPLYSGAQKYELGTRQIVGVDYFMLAVDKFAPIFGFAQKDALSDFEMLNGCFGLAPIVLDTSAGFLGKWLSDGKNQLFVKDDCGVITWSDFSHTQKIGWTDETFQDILAANEMEILSGKRFLTFWVSTLKDELRKKDKIKMGKTRVFEQPSLDYSLLFRKYFGEFLASFRSMAGFKAHHLIGVDKEAAWAEVWKGLSFKSAYGLDLDFQDYDGHVPQIAFDFFQQVTDRFYSKCSGASARHVLIDMLRNSYHSVGELFCESHSGNKSGNPATDVFNSMTNVWFIYSAYLAGRFYSGAEVTLRDFDDEISLLTYGDDVILSADEKGQIYINKESIHAVANCYGMKVTSGLKTLDIAYRPLRELTFLKTPFRVTVECVFAPLPEEVIHRELSWQKKSHHGNLEILNQRVEAALQFAVHHGKAFYNSLVNQLSSMGHPSYETWEFRYALLLSKQNDFRFSHQLPFKHTLLYMETDDVSDDEELLVDYTGWLLD